MQPTNSHNLLGLEFHQSDRPICLWRQMMPVNFQLWLCPLPFVLQHRLVVPVYLSDTAGPLCWFYPRICCNLQPRICFINEKRILCYVIISGVSTCQLTYCIAATLHRCILIFYNINGTWHNTYITSLLFIPSLNPTFILDSPSPRFMWLYFSQMNISKIYNKSFS